MTKMGDNYSSGLGGAESVRSCRAEGKPRGPLVVSMGPGLLWLGIMLVGPMLLLLAISFSTRGEYGQVGLPLTMENYKRLAGFGWLGFDPLYPVILLRSIVLGAATALGCLLCGLPLAFFIAGLPSRLRTIALVALMVPFWTNLLIRTYAWQLLLAPEGLLGGFSLYPGYGAVLIGMVCDFLPFMTLPLYVSVEKIDWNLAEAAMDLGADSFNVFRTAVFPQILPGVISGSVLVALPATGQFVIPDLLGGAKTTLLGNAIQQQFGVSRDWPFGAALSIVAIGLVLLGFSIYQSRTGPKDQLPV